MNIWKPRCARVIAYERTLGITNVNKRSQYRLTRYNYPPNPQYPIVNAEGNERPSRSWMDWFTASLKYGLTWLSHMYTLQAAMFRSFIISTLNNIITNLAIDIEQCSVDRIILAYNSNVM